MGDTQDFKANQGALFVQVDGPGTEPLYVGCQEADDLDEPKGDIELIHCFNDLGEFVAKGFTQSAPDPVTTTLTTFISETADFLEDIKCPATIYFHLRCDGRAGVFTNYLRTFYFNLAAVTNITRSALLMRDEKTVSEQAFALSGLPPVYTGFAWRALRQDTSETEALNDIAFCNAERCQGPCGAQQSICTVGLVVGDAAAGSPANLANVLRTINGGGAWAATATDPFIGGEDIAAGICFTFSRGVTRILVARGTTDAGNPAEVAYSDDDGATWQTANVGSVNGQYCPGPNALFALDKSNIWMTTQDGYIYKSENGGVTWTAQESGSITAGQYNAIMFVDTRFGFAGANSDIIIFTNDGGLTWSQMTATGGADNILDLHVHDRNFLLAFTSGGDVYISFDGATTWDIRPFPSSGTGSIPDADFVTQLAGSMIHTVGGVSTILTTIDGGFTWEPMTTPTNTGLNALYMCATDLLFAVGEPQGGTAVILKATAG